MKQLNRSVHRKVSSSLKNEEGLTLVELLAVVIILAIMSGIGVVGIGRVIDNSRKDAEIKNVLQVMEVAKLLKRQMYDVEESSFITMTADEMITQQYLEGIQFKKASSIIVENDPITNSLNLTVEVGALEAGGKLNKKSVQKNENQLNEITRESLW